MRPASIKHLPWFGKKCQRVAPIDQPREDDDKEWWRDLVDRVLNEVAPATKDLDRDNFFELAYEHFAEPGVWELYPDVAEVLSALHGRFELFVISNFDGRLRVILEHLGVSKYFRNIFLSSELGADKPDPLIFQRALKLSGFSPNEVLHVGDDPERDWNAAAKAGCEFSNSIATRIHCAICFSIL